MSDKVEELKRRLKAHKDEHKVRYFFLGIWWSIKRVWDWPGKKCREITWFIQRGKRGWADCDVWDFDYYLCDVIIGGITKLRDTGTGLPEGAFIKAFAIDEDSEAAQTELKKWRDILDKIVRAFSLARDISVNDRFPYTPKLTVEQAQELKCLTKEENDAVKEGFELFHKHFHNLWD